MHLFLGATAAAKYGALAVLCQSPTKFIQNSAVLYDKSNVTKIPAVVVRREDAYKLERLILKEDEVFIFLKLVGQAESNATSRNVIGDYLSHDPVHSYHRLMLVSLVGSLGVGDGVQDDGLGIVMALQVNILLNYLGSRTRGTIQTAVFSGEVTGMLGARQWRENHKYQLHNYTAVMEADIGCFQAAGIIFSVSNEAACIMWEIMGLVKNATNATLLAVMEAIPSNVMPIHGAGVSWIGLIGDNNNSAYWETKGSGMDGLDKLEPGLMDKCLVIMASVAYVLADMEKKLPRSDSNRNYGDVNSFNYK